MSKTREIIEGFLAPSQIFFLKKLSLGGWRKLIATAARKEKGSSSFAPLKWLKLNKTRRGISKNVGKNLTGYCGVACWLYSAIKTGCEMRYYKDKEHITAVTPKGREIDVTAPQHEFTKDGKNFKKAKTVKGLPFSNLEKDAKTARRFKNFVKDIGQVLKETRRKR